MDAFISVLTNKKMCVKIGSHVWLISISLLPFFVFFFGQLYNDLIAVSIVTSLMASTLKRSLCETLDFIGTSELNIN